jgi:hypothetical protein
VESTPARLSSAELEAEAAALLPDKEVCSLLDLNVLLDLGIDLAAPIDLAVAANANVAAPINAGVSANVLSAGSASGAAAQHNALISQHLDADAIATAPQHAVVDQSDPVGDAPVLPEPVVGDLFSGPLLNVDVHVTLDADIAAPIAGAVAANANVAAPINAAASANVGSLLSESTAVAVQNAVIEQSITGLAQATAEQTAAVTQ